MLSERNLLTFLCSCKAATRDKCYSRLPAACASRVRFSEPLSVAFEDDVIPKPLLDLLHYMSEEGAVVPDLFRRPGNTTEQKKLIKKLSEGRPVIYSDYNFYTLASVIKRFLLCIPGGIFGLELEHRALRVLDCKSREDQLVELGRIVHSLSRSVQRFTTLLFGVWYRIADKHHLHKMTSEAMAKSVTGSIFLNATGDPQLVNDAAKVMQIMIENFPSDKLFGRENLDFFYGVTHVDVWTDGRVAADAVDNEVPTSEELRPGVNKYEVLQSRQLDRLRQRSDWFLSPRSTESSPKHDRALRKAKTYMSRRTIACMPIGSIYDDDNDDGGRGDVEEITLNDELDRSY